jgi:hypothetical protein
MTCTASAYHVVLAVKDERGTRSPPSGGLRSLTAVRVVIRGTRAIPPKTHTENQS